MPEHPSQEDQTPSVNAPFSSDPQPENLKDRLRDFYAYSRPLISVNLAWFVMSLPILTALPALGGLYHAVLSYHRGRTPGWHTVWDGVKKSGWLSIKWGLAVLIGYTLSGGALWYLNTLAQDWATFAAAAAGAFMFLWTAITQFSLPLLFLQSEQKVWIAIRNGYVLTVRRPMDALKTLLLTAVIAALSTALAPSWIFISMALIANLQIRNALAAVEKIRSSDAENDAAEAYREESKSENPQLGENVQEK